ncbi:MAG: hypothetical protein GY811_17930, partial [Myxococcales bacterium]|nr:hypothetical protein [Myxococcales bacterium]
MSIFVGLGCDSSDPAGSGVDADIGGEQVASVCQQDDEGQLRPEEWGKASHCPNEPADYDLLFDDTDIRRIDITVSAENYAATQADLEEIYGSDSGGPGGGGPPGGPPDMMGDDEDPMWVPVTVAYEGLTWWEVGMRYKGNSSLRDGFQNGIGKLPFRLDFDEFEDENPTLEDQRFWGFKKMTFANGHRDYSFMRNKLAAEVFRAMDVPTAMGTWARVYVDVGDGPVYWGLY